MNGAPEVVVAGCGYLGSRVARRLHRAGKEVLGINRTGRLEGETAEWSMRSADLTRDSDVETLAAEWGGPLEALVVCLSSRGGGPQVYRKIYLETTLRLLRLWRPGKIVFTGSTSVYPQTGGEPVDETTPAEPSRETGKILRETENHVLAVGGVVARLAGLYGPGRCALLKKFLADEAFLEGDGGKFTNYVHIDDAAVALALLIDRGEPGHIYNVSDGTPLTQLEIYSWLSERTGRPLPPVGPPDLKRKRGWSNKRVSSSRLQQLGWSPAWSDLRAGIGSLLKSGEPGDVSV